MRISIFEAAMIGRVAGGWAKSYGALALLVVATAGITWVLGKWIIAPGYVDPTSRMYTSKLGYAQLQRKTGKPFPVATGTPAYRDFTAYFLGEGLCQSEPIQVPLIPMGRILKVHVSEGERVVKGQLLAELDDSKAKIKLAAARAALQTAEAEFERTRIGSAYVLDQERPERDVIRKAQLEEEVRIRSELVEMTRSLLESRSVGRSEWLQQRLATSKAEAALKELQWALEVAVAGKEQSLKIAEAAIAEATLAVEHRETELIDYRVYAPVDGIVERCLIHEGEYNQDPGKPAFLIAAGLWFTAHLDQTSIGQFDLGSEVDLHLEAFPGEVLVERSTRYNRLSAITSGGLKPIVRSGRLVPVRRSGQRRIVCRSSLRRTSHE